jgi:hypothetical protein
MKFKTTIIAATLLLSITSSHASFTETDWQNAGDARATLDTETGIEWLDLTETENQSVNLVISLLDSDYLGWRLPTQAEVSALYSNAFNSVATPTNPNQNETPTSSIETNEWRSKFGGMPGYGYDQSAGFFKGDDQGIYLSGVGGRQPSVSYHLLSWGYSANTAEIAAGVFLVSDGGITLSSQLDPSLNINNPNAPVADVSVPALLGLFGFGALALGVRRKTDR